MTAALNLDEIDTALLDLLQHDSGRTLRELGDLVGLTPSAVQRRLTRYRRTGLVTRQVAVLDPHRLGPTLLATVLVTLRHESLANHRVFARRMLAAPRVQQCYRISGHWDYLVMLTADGARHLSRLGDRLFKADDNVQRYETSVVFDTVKAGLTVAMTGDDDEVP